MEDTLIKSWVPKIQSSILTELSKQAEIFSTKKMLNLWVGNLAKEESLRAFKRMD